MFFGYSVSLSSDGSIIAIGTDKSPTSTVSIYQNIDNEWIQVDSQIVSDSSSSGLGASVSISSDGSIVAAGTVVPLGVNIPEGSLVAGVPGTVKRQLSGDERLKLKGWAEKYFSVKDEHQKLSVSENSSI